MGAGHSLALTTVLGKKLGIEIPEGAIGIVGALLGIDDVSGVAFDLAPGQTLIFVTPSGVAIQLGRSTGDTDGDPGAGTITQTIGTVIEFIVTDPATGLAVTDLAAPIELTFGFDASAIPPALTTDDVAVFFWDASIGSWSELASTVDPVTGEVTAIVEHLTVFAVMVKIPVQRDLSADLRYYGITDNYLAFGFKDRFDTTGALDRYGFPRTSEAIERGVTAQWFQRARFEWHPDNPEGFRVLIGLIGSELLELRGISFPKVEQAATPLAGFRYFPETGHYVAFAFLKYFDENGGINSFGYAVSEEIVENGFVVQYFQRGRMEYHPGNAGTPCEVQLGLLGDEILKLSGRCPDC